MPHASGVKPFVKVMVQGGEEAALGVGLSGKTEVLSLSRTVALGLSHCDRKSHLNFIGHDFVFCCFWFSSVYVQHMILIESGGGRERKIPRFLLLFPPVFANYRSHFLH